MSELLAFLGATGMVVAVGVLAAGAAYHGVRWEGLGSVLNAHGLIPERFRPLVAMASPVLMAVPPFIAVSGWFSGRDSMLAWGVLASSGGLACLAAYAGALVAVGRDAPCGCLSLTERASRWTSFRALIFGAAGLPGGAALLRGSTSFAFLSWSAVVGAFLVAIWFVGVVWHANLVSESRIRPVRAYP